MRKVALGAALFALCTAATPVFGKAGAKSAAKSEAASATAAAHAAAKGDPLLEALLTELDRSTATLKMDQVQRPYYLEYRVHDVEDFNTEAAFGALREDQRTWILFRGTHCRYASVEYEGGVEFPARYAACQTEMTNTREAQLRDATKAK